MSKLNFYTVWRGRQTGVFSSYTQCERSVLGFKGALFQGFTTAEQARHAYKLGYEGYMNYLKDQEDQFQDPLW